MTSWDDYYDPSEFDETMAEFKQSIIDNVREGLKTKIQMLEKENAELREIKANWKTIEAEHRNAVYELRLFHKSAPRFVQ